MADLGCDRRRRVSGPAARTYGRVYVSRAAPVQKSARSLSWRAPCRARYASPMWRCYTPRFCRRENTPMSTTATVSPEVIFDALFAYEQSAALKAAIDIGLFTAIDEGRTDVNGIAAHTGASARGVRILCDFLTTMALLTQSNQQYGLSSTSAVFLSRDSPQYVGTVAQFLPLPDLKRDFDDLTGAVKRGGVAPSGNTVATENPIWVEFARAMVPMAMANALAIADLIEVRGADARVLDIAAGHGMYGIVLAQ